MCIRIQYPLIPFFIMNHLHSHFYSSRIYNYSFNKELQRLCFPHCLEHNQHQVPGILICIRLLYKTT